MNKESCFPIVAEHVSYILIDGEGVLLNQKTSKYLGLNSTGTRIFEMLQMGCTSEQVVAGLAALYRTPNDIVRRDVLIFLEEAARHGLVAFSPAPGTIVGARLDTVDTPVRTMEIPVHPVRARSIPFLIVRAYALLFIIDWRLKFSKFDTVLRWLKSRDSRCPKEINSAQRDHTLIQQVRRAVTISTRFYYRTRKDCLPNAMLAYYLLKERGVPVKFCIGVTKFPFKGHAWVEYKGQVVFTTPASLWKYRPIMSI
jgi:hypothetical protein